MDFEPMKWAAGGAFRGAAKLLAFFAAFFLSPAIAGLEPFFIYVPRVCARKASLHPRLYPCARFAG